MSLDDKGRLMLPSKLRGELPGNRLVLTRGIDSCLWLFTPEEWARVSESLMGAASPFQQQARLIQRWIIAPATEIDLDKSGRLNIPPSLQKAAGLSKDCVILGIKNYLEIWDADAYNTYLSESESDFLQAAEELGKLL